MYRSKNRFLTLICIVYAGLGAFAQQPASQEAIIECHYHHTAMRDTVARRYAADQMVLRVGKAYAVFYSQPTYFADSLLHTESGRQVWASLMQAAIQSGNIAAKPGAQTTDDYLFKNYPRNRITTKTQLLVDPVTIVEPYETQQWQLVDSVRTIGGYTCHLAQCSFRGRHYEAWYTTEIPISEGPWKFGGLPGLIVEVYDAQRDYFFTLTGVKTQHIRPLSEFDFILKQQGQRTTRKKFLKQKAAFYFRTSTSEVNQLLGLDLKAPSSDTRPRNSYDFIERDYK